MRENQTQQTIEKLKQNSTSANVITSSGSLNNNLNTNNNNNNNSNNINNVQNNNSNLNNINSTPKSIPNIDTSINLKLTDKISVLKCNNQIKELHTVLRDR